MSNNSSIKEWVESLNLDAEEEWSAPAFEYYKEGCSELRNVTEEDWASQKACDTHQIIQDRDSYLYTFRRCAICKSFLGYI